MSLSLLLLEFRGFILVHSAHISWKEYKNEGYKKIVEPFKAFPWLIFNFFLISDDRKSFYTKV